VRFAGDHRRARANRYRPKSLSEGCSGQLEDGRPSQLNSRWRPGAGCNESQPSGDDDAEGVPPLNAVTPQTHPRRIRRSLPSDSDALVDIWLRSVRDSHAFLTEADIQSLLPSVRDYFALPGLELWILCTAAGTHVGFMGLSGAAVDALFLAPEHIGQGGGTLLLEHARRLKGGPLSVDVNEQNPAALQFYLARGFTVVGRSPVDTEGRPFPLLQLRELSG